MRDPLRYLLAAVKAVQSLTPEQRQTAARQVTNAAKAVRRIAQQINTNASPPPADPLADARRAFEDYFAQTTDATPSYVEVLDADGRVIRREPLR